jgi:hypothetical protein
MNARAILTNVRRVKKMAVEVFVYIFWAPVLFNSIFNISEYTKFNDND